ncbi:hypothetical protein [uncultured Jatrophihabitans sp.]|uniref:hypothetical protein n=1 Tax=uncultured Jatrophihabitans sp. TaxID=1610747 RepID=UPI0035CA4EE0
MLATEDEDELGLRCSTVGRMPSELGAVVVVIVDGPLGGTDVDGLLGGTDVDGLLGGTDVDGLLGGTDVDGVLGGYGSAPAGAPCQLSSSMAMSATPKANTAAVRRDVSLAAEEMELDVLELDVMNLDIASQAPRCDALFAM